MIPLPQGVGEDDFKNYLSIKPLFDFLKMTKDQFIALPDDARREQIKRYVEHMQKLVINQVTFNQQNNVSVNMTDQTIGTMGDMIVITSTEGIVNDFDHSRYEKVTFSEFPGFSLMHDM